MTHRYDVTVIGAGAAGLFCAAQAGQRGLRVLLIDHSERVAEKIRISGGGRCNFTNRDLDPRAPERYFVSENPAFCRSALARYTPADFIALVQRHRIAHHEKHKGQLFCDDSSEEIIAMLLREAEAGHVQRWQPCDVQSVEPPAVGQPGAGWTVQTGRGAVHSAAVVVATGGLSIPKIGATDFGHRLARQLGLRVVPTRPALVPLTFDADAWAPYAALAGVSLPVRMATGSGRQAMRFDEDLLFTHRGLSGPAVLQISSYWQPGTPLSIDLGAGAALDEDLLAAKREEPRRLPGRWLGSRLPQRLAELWVARDAAWQRPLADSSDRALRALGQALRDWQLIPSGTEGYRKAEVTAGGVDTRELSSQTMEARRWPGLYFIGEVVDMTGWLGGYNFQWAWASAHACAQALAERKTA